MAHIASTDMDLPPPAYELTQEDLDRKISSAVEASLHISENATASSSNIDDDGFELWDEAAYQAAAAQLAQSNSMNDNASSSRPLPLPAHPVARQASPLPQKAPLPGIECLRIARNSPPREKERPSWYEEAGLGSGGSPSSSRATHAATPSSRPTPSAPLGARPGPGVQRALTRHADPYHPHRMPSDAEYDATQQPPPFSPMGPSLDGPPYEEVVLSYSQHPDSRAPSPLSSPPVTTTSLPTHRPQPQFGAMVAPTSRPQTPRAAPQPPSSSRPHAQLPDIAPLRPRHAQTMGPRPTTVYSVSSQVANTTIAFDPSSAYTKPSLLKANTSSTSAYNASAFYRLALVLCE
jgi:hypothetical protein